jgi:Ribosomal protein L7/L12 C-terminal domain
MEYTENIYFIAPQSMLNKVSVIKAIRTLTGIGLKEAKDASERQGVEQTFKICPGITQLQIEENCKILRREGFEVSPSVFKIIEDLRKLGSQALLQGEDELANEILQLVLAEKLRRKPGMLI